MTSSDGFIRSADTSRLCARRSEWLVCNWINENSLIVDLGKATFNLAQAALEIIEAYAAAKKSAFEGFIADCEKLEAIQNNKPEQVTDFIKALLAPNVDARIFEIVSYAILKEAYAGQINLVGLDLRNSETKFLDSI